MPPTPARILLVAFTPFPAPTGPSTRLAQRILALSAAGYSLDVITPKTSSLPHVSTLATARIFRVPLAGLRDSSPGAPRFREDTSALLADQLAAFERAVRRQLQGNEYDAIHLFDPAATAAVLNHREQAVLTYEATGAHLAPDDPALSAELARRDGRLLESAAAIFVTGRHAAAELEAKGIWPGRIHVLRPSVDLDLFQPAPDLSNRGPAPCRIAVVATRLHSDELALLGGAILRLRNDTQVRVVVSASVGLDDRRQLESDAALRDRFALHNPVLYDDLVPFYASCDAGLVLSTGRSRGERLLPVAEIFAAGLAPILPDAPSIRELVGGDGDALLVPPGDVESLTRAIELVAADDRLRRHLGRTARQIATARLDERRVAGALQKVYRDLLSQVRRITEETPRPVGDGPMHLHIDSLMRESAAPDRGGQSGADATVSQRTPSRPPPASRSDDPTTPGTEAPSPDRRGS